MSDDKKSPRVITNAEYVKTLSALSALHTVFGAEEFSKDGATALAPVKDATVEELGYLLSRTLAALQNKQVAEERALIAGAKTKIDAILHGARVSKIKAWKKINALVSADPSVAQMLGDAVNPPTQASVTVSEVLDCFPSHPNADEAVKLLVRMSYKVSSGKTAGERRVIAPINVEALAAE